MSLLDEIVSFDMAEGTLSAAFSARREWAENWSAIEYMAQAAAALVGAADREGGYDGPPKPGFLLGTRKLELDFPRFEPGRRYVATARSVFVDGAAASFDCEILDGERVLARATLNAYRPEDIAAFMSSKTEGEK